jgi:uncharacterized protein (TIGR03083 family)
MTSDQLDPELQVVLDVLSASVDRLADVVRPLSPEQVRQQAYPTEWTVANVLSHLGSGATITRQRLDGEVDPQPIWDEWNAKDPDTQAADALRADAALQRRLAAISPEEATNLRFAMGPIELDLISFLKMRVSEHSLHTWDIAVTFDPAATVPPDAAAVVIDMLAMVAGFAGKPTGADRSLTIATTEPERRFELNLRPDSVALSPSEFVSSPDIELSSDALIRLVYGRLDPDHSLVLQTGAEDLEELRNTFPGF